MELSPSARKIRAQLLQLMDEVGGVLIADATGLDQSTVSRMKTPQGSNRLSEVDRWAVMLDLAKRKVVRRSMRCYPEEQIEAIFQLARAHMTQMSTARELSRDLEWEEGV